MTFEVKYRNKQGATEYIRVDAGSRSEVFTVLKDRGITSVIQVMDATGKKPRKAATSGAPISGVVKGLVALVAVVAIGAGVYFMLASDAPAPEKKEAPAKVKTIAETAPEVVVAPKVEETPVVEKKKRFWEVDASETNGFTRMQMKKWEIAHRPPPGYTNDAVRTRAKARCHIFNHRSENEIAMLLTTEPGQGMIGSPIYRGMNEDFQKSLSEPILINAEDDDYTRDLKKLMNETKADLADRIRKGEDLEQILKNTREEYQRLAQYKMMLQQELRKFTKDSEHTDQDVDDFVKAANSLLEEKGIAPLNVGPITRRRLATLKGEY